MEEPIESLVRNESQLLVARLQDTVTQIIFDNTNAVMYGGTAIWRCYNGKRFSEDIDLYINKKTDIKRITDRAVLSGLRINFNRRRKGTIYYDISDNEANISLQIRIAKKRGILVTYERASGIRSEIYSLAPETLVEEKIAAYQNRELIRDVYDIMVLTKSISNKDSVKSQLRAFLSEIQKPKDASALKSLIYSGPIPSFDEIIEYLGRWCSL